MSLDTAVGLYIDDDGRAIATHSMLKTFRRCPKQAEFKYVHRLKPRLIGGPLKRGSWVHALLEEHHNGGDWRELHKKFTHKFNQMFDEEKDFYGDMPTEIYRVMQSYEWHYKADPWKVLETEFTIETEFPDGTVYRGKVDALIENQFGLWLVDHKSHKTLPDHNFRLLDAQSALYLWAALRNGIKVNGFIWNYLRWKAPSVPPVVDLKSGHPRLSKSPCDTDYPTYLAAIKKYKEEVPGFRITQDYKDRLEYLKRLRYQPGMPQESTFFRRDVLEKQNSMLREVALENYHTAKRMNKYYLEKVAVERVVERSCTFSCSFTDICTAELMGANIQPIIKQNYTIGDPNDYYQDRAGNAEKEER